MISTFLLTFLLSKRMTFPVTFRRHILHILALVTYGSMAGAAVLIRDYEFNGNLTDTKGGPALVSAGGTIKSASYAFAAQQGLSLSSWTGVANDGANYTLDISCKITSTNGVEAKVGKLIDVKNLTSDDGFYRFGQTSALNWYNGTDPNGGDNLGTAGMFPLNLYVRLVVTRNATTKALVGYLNGAVQFTITDSFDTGIFDAANSVMRFFQDDAVTTGTEFATGEVNQIRIYSGPMTAAEVAALGGAKALPADPSANGVYAWTNLAGTPSGVGTADGTGTVARFYSPAGVAMDSAGTVYVADKENHTIRKVTAAGVVTTIAGAAGISGGADGTAGVARFYRPSGVALDSTATNLYITDSNHTIRKLVLATGVVTTLAGKTDNSGSTDGTGANALFDGPSGIAVSSAGNLYVADSGHTIRKVVIATGVVTTIAGTAGTSGNTDGVGAAARFNNPAGVALDSAGTTLYIADEDNKSIRKLVLATAAVSRFAGSSTGLGGSADGAADNARFVTPTGIGLDSSGNIFVADTDNNTIRKVTAAGTVTTLAGAAAVDGSDLGTADGTGSAARFMGPVGIAVNASGTLALADRGNHTIRKISTSTAAVTTLAGSPAAFGATNATGSAARFKTPFGLALDSSGNLYVADVVNHLIRKVTAAGVVTTLAGTAGVAGSTNATGTAAKFYLPLGVAVDSAGNVYVADTYNHLIRKITAAGAVTTLAGTVGTAGSADGTGVAAQFNHPKGVAVDGSGNVYVADSENCTIRKITSAGVVTTLAGSAGLAGNSDGIASAARFTLPVGIAVDASGNLYIGDEDRGTIRKITPGGLVSTLAGKAGDNGGSDGIGAEAHFGSPDGVAVDAFGNVFVSDSSNNAIRKITASGVVTTIGGNRVGIAGGADGLGAAARFDYPTGIAVSSTGVLYVADSDNNRITKGTLSTLANVSVIQGSSDPLTDGIESVDFGDNSSAGPISQTFTITNTGTAALTGLSLTKDGPQSADFTLGTLGTTTLAAGASKSFTISFTPTALGVRQAAVHIASSVTGTANPFDINVNGVGVTAPANNNFANRINLGSAATVDTNGTNVGASLEANELTYGGLAGASVWYEWTAPSTGWTTIHTSGTSLDTVIGLYTGTTLAGLTELGFNDSSGRDTDAGSDPSRLVFFATSGSSYKIAVAGYVSTGYAVLRDTFQLHIAAEPTPDFLVTAMSFTPTSANVTTATKDVSLQISVTSTNPLFTGGQGYLQASLVPPNQDGNGPDFTYSDTDRTSGSTTSGTYVHTATIPRYIAAGAWAIKIKSGASQTQWTTPGNDLIADSYLIPSSIAATLTVTNTGTVDTTAPTLVSISGLPDVVDVTAGDVSFNVDIAFTDATAGLSNVYIGGDGGNNGYGFDGSGQSSLVSGTLNNGVYRVPVTIGQNTLSGIYFTTVQLSDAVQNEVSYSDRDGGQHPIPAASAGHFFQVIGTPVAPELMVVQNGAVLQDNTSTVDFGSVSSPSSQTLSFTLDNSGTTELGDLSLSVDGANSTDFMFSVLAELTVRPGNSTSFTVTFTPSGSGLRTAVLHVHSNIVGSQNPFDINLTGTGSSASGITGWRQTYFFSPDNLGNGANGADPNKNGITNLMEYALGGDPAGHTTGQEILPQGTRNSALNCLQISFTRYLNRTDITLVVQAADALAGPWTSLAQSINGADFTILTPGTTLADTGAQATHSVTVCDLFQTNDPNHKHRFMRLKVTQ